jgi:hypothetical protein
VPGTGSTLRMDALLPSAADSDRERLKSFSSMLREREFPPASSDEELSVFFTDLAIYDGEIAGLVARLTDGERIPRKYLGHLRQRHDLENQLAKLAMSDNAQTAKTARAYLSYLIDLHHVVALAKTVAERDY